MGAAGQNGKPGPVSRTIRHAAVQPVRMIFGSRADVIKHKLWFCQAGKRLHDSGRLSRLARGG
jgi:hypothetical protein